MIKRFFIAKKVKRMKMKSLNQKDRVMCQRFQNSLMLWAAKGLLKFIGVWMPIK